jgi:predicted ABC-type ATPase
MATLIVVSGPNGAGKSTLIYSCQKQLSQLGYVLIIPDDIISESETPISDAVESCIAKNNDTVFETPLQYDELAHQVQKFAQAGYKIILIQLFLESEESSALRVKQRAAKGGRDIETKEIRKNFSGNIKNVVKHYHLFQQSYFIDASTINNPVTAELQEGVIKFYNPVSSVCFSKLIYAIIKQHNPDKQMFSILKSNKVFGELSYKKMTKALQAILRLKK